MLFRFSTSRQTLTWIPDSFFTRSVVKSIDFCQDRSIVFILFNHVHMSDSACLRNIYFLRSRAYLIVSIFFSTLSKRFVRFCLAICVTLTGFFYFYILVCWVGVSLHTEMKQERYVTFCTLVIYPNISWKLYLLPLTFVYPNTEKD